MSKKPSENQKPRRKFTESYFPSDSATATSNEENSLERRLFTLIGNELRRTTAENEFATLETRIIRILRNEFVNDIMMEINTSDDEIATLFNRFIRSVPELREVCDRTGNDHTRRDSVHIQQGEVERPTQSEEKRETKEGKRTSRGLDENNIIIVLEMFRIPILITCRACEDIRRIIRSGRRMIGEIQLIAALRGDFNSLRRIELKCIDELDSGRNTRYRRQASSIGNWRQLFRRRSRNILPSSCRERGCYYVVFDKPEKPRIVQQISAKYSSIMNLRKKCTIFTKKCPKQSTKRWNEYSAKADISKVIQCLRCVYSRSYMDSSNTSVESNTETTLLACLAEDSSHTAVTMAQENSSLVNVNTSGEAESIRSPIIDSGRTDPNPAICHISMECEDLHRLPITSSTQTSYIQERPSQEISSTLLREASGQLLSAGDGLREFSVTLRTGSAQPQDVTVVLHSDRVLVASVARSSRECPSAWSGRLQRHWLLPEHVDADSIRCYLGGGNLVITEFPLSDFQWPLDCEFVALGPPARNASPYPFPFDRRP